MPRDVFETLWNFDIWPTFANIFLAGFYLLSLIGHRFWPSTLIFGMMICPYGILEIQLSLVDWDYSLGTYCCLWHLKINVEKTVYSIFTRSYKLVNEEITLKVDGNSLKKESNPVYLGVELDTKLNLKQHTSNLRKKGLKRLNLIKRLASTTWGSDKNTLRSLYLGYTRAVFDYNIVLQNICSKSLKNSLDPVQNQAICLISGEMRTSPTAACEIHTNIEPLENRRLWKHLRDPRGWSIIIPIEFLWTNEVKTTSRY